MLVEDDALIRISTAEMVESLGHTVRCAQDGESALKLLADAPADILMTDVGLPDLSGTNLARRAVQRWPGLKVIFASGDERASHDAGLPQAHNLVKPYAPEQVAAVLARVASQVAGAAPPPTA